jgi:formamidopyrimidine-DNA glycosylase
MVLGTGMPELPEVETIVNNLHQGSQGMPSLLGRRITGAQLLWERTLETPTFSEFNRRVLGQVIEDIRRRGKFIVFSLSSEALLIHLRMSGDLLIEAGSAPVARHHRLILELDEDIRLAFNDARKFGRAWLVADPATVLKALGPEPLDPDFTPGLFYQRLQFHHRQLKPLLLDQAFLAGLGNIYTDEALHLAKLHPLTLAHSLSFPEAERLLDSIRQVLQEGIQRNGASIDWVYRGGDFQNYFRVYQRTGEPCPVCSTTIQRIIVGQRGTHFCPTCQTIHK